MNWYGVFIETHLLEEAAECQQAFRRAMSKDIDSPGV
jgi:hypothetical protein